MVGFRNVAVREYRNLNLNLNLIQSIVEDHLTGFPQFTEIVVQADGFRREK